VWCRGQFSTSSLGIASKSIRASGKEDGLGQGAIAGIVIGILAMLIIAAGVAMMISKNMAKAARAQAHQLPVRS
jgi:hypothetical protein